MRFGEKMRLRSVSTLREILVGFLPVGRSLHSVEKLLPPLLLVDERIIEFPRGTQLHVPEKIQCHKLLLFLEADHDLFVEGYPAMHIQGGDMLIQPLLTTQVYRPRKANSDTRIGLLRILFDLPLLPASRRVALAKLPRDEDCDLSEFIGAYFNDLYHLPGHLTPRIHEMVSIIRKETEERRRGYRLRVSSICLELVTDAVRRLYTSREEEASAPVSRQGAIVERVKEFLIENHSRPLSLEEIAWHVRFSREHLARVFRDVTGQTVFEYLTFLRIESAKGLLGNTGLLIHEVAHRTGFSSSTLFGRIFRRAAGITPQEYRNRRMGEVRFQPSVRTSAAPGRTRHSASI